jgi:hypothetical protein
MTHVNEPVSVWMSQDGRPRQLVWRSREFTVTDVPTPLDPLPEPILDFVTHPPVRAAGWRFQGTSSDGATHVFDISHDDSRGQWRLLRTYD